MKKRIVFSFSNNKVCLIMLFRYIKISLMVPLLILIFSSHPGLTQKRPDAAPSNVEQTSPDGQRDFDFHIGTWKTHLKRLRYALTDSSTWVEYEGTTIVRKVWDGRANLVELDVTGAAGHIVGLSLRLYNPDSRQWSLNFANINSGIMGLPTIGEFKNGSGEFYNQETFNGRAILVRFVISEITENSCHFEQSFSDDGGKTWEVNWIATDTRTKGKEN
jgi:hypothetical protein